MLEARKSITLTGTSNIEQTSGGNIPVVYMSASVAEDGTPNVSKSIQDKETYLANKEQCKADMDEFEEMAWALVK